MRNGEIIVDNFAGGGGASTGIELAIGRSVDIAINHDPTAIAMHKTNHPTTKHYCESVWDVDPVEACEGRPVGLAWFSPDCKHFSKAKGGKPRDKNIRGLAWVTVKWGGKVKPRILMLENVEEFQDWGPLIAARDKKTGRVLKKDGYKNEKGKFVHYVAEPGERIPLSEQLLIPDPKRKGMYFRKFVNELKKLGYTVEWKVLVACNYGAPTSRKRFFLVARCDGLKIVWPEPTHGSPDSLEVQLGLLKPWKTAAEIIDWSLWCPSIFNRKRPLAENTVKRIAKGAKKFVIDNLRPFIVQVNHGGDNFRGQNIDEPMPTVTAKHGFGVVSPYISMIGQTGFSEERSRSIEEPLATVVSKNEHCLIAPTLIQYHTETVQSEIRGYQVEEPLRTLDTSNRYGLVESHLVKFKGDNIGQVANEPLQTITAGGMHFGEVRSYLTTYYGNQDDIGQSVFGPLRTIVSKDRFGLVSVTITKTNASTSDLGNWVKIRDILNKYCEYNIAEDEILLLKINSKYYFIYDLGLRMLEPRELFNANGFPRYYIIDRDYTGKPFPKSAQVAKCGNAVPPPFSEALTRANIPEYCLDEKAG
ncbi:DNA cytosine methyltransferase [Ruminiclostridium cellobioparum]|uniref:DNA cytosine methyltransferase n=1 Tax=Ruminiclostridium cellobioparum TaxID=29355 RepID=UPI0028B17275|nr:DNA cytosine methyltransferase [Ruminiclostridium cellobioparum]